MGKREALRGVAERVLDHIFEAFSSEQWADLLETPLDRAATHGDQDLVQKLVEAGAADTGYALHSALQNRHKSIVHILLENGAPVNSRNLHGFAPLHVAVRVGDADMIRSFLLKGADKDTLDDHGFTALYWAAHFGHLAATKYLLAAGADAGLRCGQFKELALHAVALEGHDVDVLRALIEDAGDVDARGAGEATALHLTCLSGGTVEMIDVLVEAGANIDARDMYCNTPLHHAAEQFTPGAVLALARHGAEANAKTHSGQTPLHDAAFHAGRQGTAETVGALLRLGADEMAVDVDGCTPADVTGDYFGENTGLVEDFERASKLLENAPADRAWRRRGYLALCRAHPDRPQLRNESSEPHAGTATRTAKPRTAEVNNGRIGVGSSGAAVREGASDDWAEVMAWVLRLAEDGIYRKVVGFL